MVSYYRVTHLVLYSKDYFFIAHEQSTVVVAAIDVTLEQMNVSTQLTHNILSKIKEKTI
jgi:hypothetical protein